MNDSFYPISSQCVTPVLSKVIQSISSHFHFKRIEKKASEYISKNFAFQEKQSFEQMRSTIPRRPQRTSQDQKPTPGKAQTIRPFSAKIRMVKLQSSYKGKNQLTVDKAFEENIKSSSHLKPTKTQKRLSNRSHITNRSTKSFKNFKEKQEIISNKFIPLNSSQQSIEQEVFGKLRVNKLQAQQYEVKKQKFLEGMNKQTQIYNQNQLKFLNSMNKKPFTYNYEGGILERNKNPKLNNKIKKTTQFKTLTKNGDLIDDKQNIIHVGYKRKDEKEVNTQKNFLKQEQENLNQMLIWKSQNAKYTIK